MSNYLENKLVDHTLGTTAYTKPTNVYLALYTSDPTDANTGTEVSGSGYARQLITWNAASSGSSTNNTAETFSASGGSWGTVTHIGIFDALTGGNLLLYANLTTSRPVNDGDSLLFAVGSITVTYS